MPLIFRSMKLDGDKPLISDGIHGLGVRDRDIAVSASGMVAPATGGMSVAPSLEALARFPFLISRRLTVRGDPFRGARAPDNVFTWRMGEGPFSPGEVAPKLILRPDEGIAPVHGVVEPDREMPMRAYRDAIEETQGSWEFGEE